MNETKNTVLTADDWGENCLTAVSVRQALEEE